MLALVTAAQLKQHGIQHPCIVGHLRAGLFRHFLKLFPFPGGDKDGGAGLLLYFRDFGGDVHPGTEQRNQRVVNFVNFLAKFCKIHVYFLLFVWVLPSSISKMAMAAAASATGTALGTMQGSWRPFTVSSWGQFRERLTLA